jgi:hypothetical protein
MTWCGVSVGLLIGASALYGATGFLFMVNKAFVACITPIVL